MKYLELTMAFFSKIEQAETLIRHEDTYIRNVAKHADFAIANTNAESNLDTAELGRYRVLKDNYRDARKAFETFKSEPNAIALVTANHHLMGFKCAQGFKFHSLCDYFNKKSSSLDLTAQLHMC